MATTNTSPDQLIEIAKERKLTPNERRECIRYLDDQDDADYSNYELADMFKVSEKIIREDKKRILAEYSQGISPMDALSYVGQFIRKHDQLILKATKGLLACKPGTQGHQQYLRTISDLEKRRIEILQEIGAVPKELGRLNVTEEKWVAAVSPEGIVTCGPASVMDGQKQLPASTAEPAEVFDVQFSEVPSEEE